MKGPGILDFFSAARFVGSEAYNGEEGDIGAIGSCCGDAKARNLGVSQLKSP